MRYPLWAVLVGVVVCVPSVAADEGSVDAALLPAPADRTVDFNLDIQPLLQARCVSCHGADRQRAGFRLDHKESALRGGDSGPSIVPGDSAGSRLIRYVSGLDPDFVMPPEGDRLTPEEVGLLRAWIDGGAEWPESSDASVAAPPEHWAFRPPQRPEPPAIQSAEGCRNEIDLFVRAKLEEFGIEPSPEADRATLIRRLTLDLTGLAPTPEEVDEFVSDESPYAYERLVNRLLASPHFGEQWGRHWLDLARYADSDGFEKDTVRPHAWRYRQWVIDALNRDLPYDRFIIEQLAGDLLPNATDEQRVATGFHRNTLTNKEGGVDPEEYRVQQVIDRTNTTGAALLGLTVGCAQCHSHKYDPITHREYFQLYAFFNTAVEKDIPAPLPGEVQAYKDALERHSRERAEIQKGLDARKNELAAELPAWEAQQAVSEVDWQVLEPAGAVSAGGARLVIQDDGSIRAEGHAPVKDTYTVVATTPETGITGLRLEVLTDPSLPGSGPGRAGNGNLVLSEFSVRAAQLPDPTTARALEIQGAWAGHAQEGFAAAAAVDGDAKTGWAIGGVKDVHVDRVAEFTFAMPAGFPEGTTFSITLDQQHGDTHTLGRFRLSWTKAAPELLAIPGDVRQALLTPADQRDEAQKAVVLNYFAMKDAAYRELHARLEGHERATPAPPDTMAQTLAKNPEPPTTHILLRGDFLQKGEEVTPGVPAVLPPLKPRGPVADRLDLARWIVSADNPLASRVAVNRVWEHLFDRGLVYTSEDFGTRGEPPSHPELLDWLATEFIARGWSLKDFIRLVVNSATYRQESRVRTELVEWDPKNVWLARQSRFRVSAENIRDLALEVSGLLNPVVGGKSIRPPLPPGVAELGYAGSVKWPESQGPDRYRRGLYILFQRTVPYPTLMTFDCPDSNVTAIRRARSNTPLQALTLLNDPVFVECAQAFGRRIATEAPKDTAERVRHAFRLALGRTPTEGELNRLCSLVEAQREAYRENAEAAARLTGGALGPDIETNEAAACVALARTLMNLDEFITRE